MTFPRPARVTRAACLTACATLALSACASVPDLGPKPQMKPLHAVQLDLPKAEWPAESWWLAYHDPQLNQLIEEALAGAPDMAQAAARIRKADALAQQAGAAGKPTLGAAGQFKQLRMSQNDQAPAAFVPDGWVSSGQFGLELSRDLDLWGKNRAQLASATSEAEAVRADAANARLTLSTAIASAYADLARLHADADAADHALAIRSQTEVLLRQRLEQGLETQAAVRRAASNRAMALADVAAMTESLAIGRNRLSALVGQGPERGLAIAPPVMSMDWRFGLPEDLATGLIGRRPDVIAARLRAEAAAKRIDAAKADFYPSIKVSALIGMRSIGVDKLSDAHSTYGSYGPAVSLPIFTGGALQGAYRASRADYDASVAAYDATLNRALQEVADAAVSAAALPPRAMRTAEALDAAEDAYRLTMTRYGGGLATYLDVLSAEDAVIGARRAMAEMQTRAFSVDVALVRALGGGFRPSNLNLANR